MSFSRADIVAEARLWLGTPYRHQASVRGAGCDCLGLVRGVWRALGGPDVTAPPYAPDWDERGGEPLLDGARRWLDETHMSCAAPGDVIAFRMVAGAAAKHAAILVTPDRIVHAWWGRAVIESRLTPWWRARRAAAFSFPGVNSWPR
jgi:NlpC/P60 family putative phage cell wall peptidase